MREYINIVSGVLTESRGLGARKTGEEFVSVTDPDDKIYVYEIRFYPEQGQAYESVEARNQELQQVVNSLPNTYVDLIGQFRDSDLAFGIAVFNRPGSQRLGFVKPFKELKPDTQLMNWDNQTGIPGYRYNSKAAAKTQAGMTPQDVLAKPSDLTASDIVAQIANKFGEQSPLTVFAQDMASGAKLPYTLEAVNDLSFTAFRDYFCELIHPIALQTGNYTGNAAAAAEQFLAPGGYADTTISFGSDKTEGLSDSIMIAPDGRKIKVSSKGEQGAQASVSNLLDAVKEIGPELASKHQDIIDLITEVKARGQSGAPLALGVRYDIISAEDAQDIMNFRKMPKTTMSAALDMGISDELKTLIRDRTTKKPDDLNLYFHAMAAVAHQVAEYVNEHTDFSAAASEILNNGALVQVYTKASDQGDSWIVQSFNTVWPSNTVTGVKFSASKNYSSTDIKGNFTFKILRNGAKDTDADDPALPEPKSSVAAPNVVTGKRVDIRPDAAVRRARGSGPGLGRARRT